VGQVLGEEWIGRLPAVSLLAELDGFYTEHRRCGELEAGVTEPVVWILVGARLIWRG
jgi:hypothetical protein